MLTIASTGVGKGVSGDVAATTQEAFAELLRVQAQPAYRLALTMLREPPAAEDAVQDAALRAWRHRRHLKSAGAFRPWFLAIVANECRSVLRTRWWRFRSTPVDEGMAAPGGAAEAADRAIDLARALSELGADDRMAVYLYYYLDLPVKEAAAAMSCSQSAFRSRLARAVRRLRPGLELAEAVGDA